MISLGKQPRDAEVCSYLVFLKSMYSTQSCVDAALSWGC